MDAERYLALRARAVRYIEEAGGAADEAALVRHVFAAESVAPWRQLLARVLAGDHRLAREADGRWCLRRSVRPQARDLPSDFVALELGLMGSHGRRLQVVEIAAFRVRGGLVVAQLVEAIQPVRRPPAYARRAARMDDEVFAAAPTFAAVADELSTFLGADILVGYDLPPQLRALTTALRMSGRPELINSTIDLLAWLLERGRVFGKPTLAAALRTVGCGEPPGARAIDRAAAIVTLVEALRQSATPASTPACGAPPHPAPAQQPVQAAVLRLKSDPPAAPGVYLLRDAAGAALYIGAARNLRQRLRSYGSLAIRRTRRMEGLHERVASVSWQTTASELSARLLEAQLIATYRPLYNVARRATHRASYVVARQAGPYLRLVVTAQPAPGERCAGPFASARAARQAWRVLADLYGLDTCRRTFRAHRRRPPCVRHTAADLCPAPCAGTISPDSYAERVDRALAFLSGQRAATLADLGAALATVRRCSRPAEATRLARLAVTAQRLPVVAVDIYRPTLVVGLVPACAQDDRSYPGVRPPADRRPEHRCENGLHSASDEAAAAPPWHERAQGPAARDALQPAAELFCLLDDALYPLQPVARPDDAEEVARAIAAALEATPLPAPAAAVAQGWLRQRPGGSVTARTIDRSAAGLAALAQVLSTRYVASVAVT